MLFKRIFYQTEIQSLMLIINARYIDKLIIHNNFLSKKHKNETQNIYQLPAHVKKLLKQTEHD